MSRQWRRHELSLSAYLSAHLSSSYRLSSSSSFALSNRTNFTLSTYIPCLFPPLWSPVSVALLVNARGCVDFQCVGWQRIRDGVRYSRYPAKTSCSRVLVASTPALSLSLAWNAPWSFCSTPFLRAYFLK